MTLRSALSLALLCALLTSIRSARAEDSHAGDARLSVRGGTSVGYAELAQNRWSTLGGHVAIGYHLGPLAIEGEYEDNRLLYFDGNENRLSGALQRLGSTLRYHLVVMNGERSRLQLFVDAGLGIQKGHVVGLGFRRNDYGGGAGFLLEHKLDRFRIPFQWIGWHLGWRFSFTERGTQAMARVVCIKKCTMTPAVPVERDQNMSLASSLTLLF